MECSDSAPEIVTNLVRGTLSIKRGLCNKIFSSNQALGGHQTFHHMSKAKRVCTEESVEREDETINKEKNTLGTDTSVVLLLLKEFQVGSCFGLPQEVSRQGTTL
ncbi:LOW QUALITY PROTEIN: hypothetical protein YC2023_123712 [Brassica napus]